MIREILSEKLTEIKDLLSPGGGGDEWMNANLTVLFPLINFIQPNRFDTSGNWLVVSEFSGEGVVRIFTNDFSPIDVTPMMIALIESPIIIEPNDEDYEVDEYAVQLKFRANKTRDLMFESGIIATIQGDITDGFILRRRETIDHSNINNVQTNFP